ncbi:MAG TPA: aspartate kinase [Firmicutes bacterium]|nr:aspartate kinase [Bacillota bacterium]
MTVIVQKYGGSSLATMDHIRRVAQTIAATKRQGYQVAVVVSAMAGETDRLIEMAKQLSSSPVVRELDALLATGEQTSAALLAIALENLGCPAQSFLGLQLPLITDNHHTKARILDLPPTKLADTLNQGKIAIIAGFQGVNSKGDITTLGRGGSDTTAVALAAALKAKACEIYTDVDGVYTADPNLCPNASHMERVTYDEMLELTGLGAKVLQIRSVELARKYDVPLLVKSFFNGDKYTWVAKEETEYMENAVVSGVTLDLSEAKISVIRVPDQPGIACRILTPLAETAINVDMIIQNASSDGFTDFTFTVPKADLEVAKQLIEEVAREINALEIRTNSSIAKVSAVGIGMKNHPGVAAKMFKALAEENINIQMISTSEIRVSCVIDAKYGELAVRIIHEAFNLGKK